MLKAFKAFLNGPAYGSNDDSLGKEALRLKELVDLPSDAQFSTRKHVAEKIRNIHWDHRALQSCAEQCAQELEQD